MNFIKIFSQRNLNIHNNYKLSKKFCTNIKSTIKKKVCIVGSGPAGFYAAQYILKHSDCEIDLIEKLPVPFGLVRFGVAPDHPEVKNVINTFSKTATNSRFRFLGNISLGNDITLQELRNKYHAVVLTYGAEVDRDLGIKNENSFNNVISARSFVAWYNGLPGAEDLKPDLNGKHATIIGQGNVAIDVARIILSSVDELKKTDITEHALEELSKSKIEKVYLVGRRGPLQAAFTIKELREMLKLPTVETVWRENDFEGVKEKIADLPRPRKRITELMISSMQSEKSLISTKKFLPIFCRSPKLILKNSIEFEVNKLDGDLAVPTNNIENIETDLVLRSIGYKSICVDKDINFDLNKGFVCNKLGRVLITNSNEFDKGLYVAGWLGTGPTGVILTTMNGAFSVAKLLCDDINSKQIDCSESKPGIQIEKKPIVTWSGWEKIDKYEIESGNKVGKPREKILEIKKMLEIAL